MIRSAAGKIMWVGRATVFLLGVAVILALVFGAASTVSAHTGNKGFFHLGHKNVKHAVSKLVGKVAGPSLVIGNGSEDPKATALRLNVKPGKAPMKVSSDAKVPKLNADKLDGKDSTDFITHDSILKSGQTIEGVWGTAADAGYGAAVIEFRPKLAADIPENNAHYVTGGSATHCPGRGQAAPGHLCVYRSGPPSMTFVGFSDPSNGRAGVHALGTVMFLESSTFSAAERGTWAVTAP